MEPIGRTHPEKILVFMPNWVGDLVMATPVLRVLRENFPDASVTVVVKSWLGDVLMGSPRYDEMILYHMRGEHAGLRGFWRFTRELRARRFDLAVALPHASRAGWMARLSCAPRRLGYDRGDRRFLLTDRVRPVREGWHWMPVPKTHYYLRMCREAGLTVSSEKLELYCTGEERAAAGELLERYGVSPDDRFVLVTPGANFGSSKCWFPDRFAAVGDHLAERHGARVGLVYGPGEEAIAQAILDHARVKPIDFSRVVLPLGTVKPLVERCDLMITNDTGPRHFAVAFDRPVIVIMGSTDPRHTASNLEKTIVLRRDVPCGPCHRPVCPTDHVCMKEISTDDVLDAAERMIAEYWT